MKSRIITACVGLPLLTVVFVFFNIPFVVEAVAGILAAVAVYELLHATGLAARRRLYIAAMVVAAALPFTFATKDVIWPFLLFAVFICYLMLTALFAHQVVSFVQICVTLFIGSAVPLAFCTLLFFRNDLQPYGLFYTLLAFGGAWLADSGAYFAGLAFGKHPLAPTISPKKTVEGAIGGLITTVLGFLLIGFLFETINNAAFPATPIHVRYLWLVVTALVLTPAGILGDLFASVIKRETNLKDFGTIMPGHGGVMDRFDSFLWTTSVLALATMMLHNFLYIVG